MITNKRIPQIDGMNIDEAHKKGAADTGPTQEQIAQTKAWEKQIWDLEDAQRRYNDAVSKYNTDYDDYTKKQSAKKGSLYDLVGSNTDTEDETPPDYAYRLKTPVTPTLAGWNAAIADIDTQRKQWEPKPYEDREATVKDRKTFKSPTRGLMSQNQGTLSWVQQEKHWRF